jgi:hypothetical protein
MTDGIIWVGLFVVCVCVGYYFALVPSWASDVAVILWCTLLSLVSEQRSQLLAEISAVLGGF